MEDGGWLVALVYALKLPTGTWITQSVGMFENALELETLGGVVGRK